MLFKKTKKQAKEFKKDIEEDLNKITTFYSNPKKYLQRVPRIIIIVFVLYILGFFGIIKYIHTGGFENLVIKLTYIVTGYMILSWLSDRYIQKRDDR